MSNTEKIEPLKRVFLTLTAGSEPGKEDLTPEPFLFSFIYGVGSEGLCPFEYEIAERGEGDEVRFSLGKTESGAFFCHLMPMLHDFFPRNPSSETLHLNAVIRKVENADSREVVREMAKLAECGDSCCGDGCCGH